MAKATVPTVKAPATPASAGTTGGTSATNPAKPTPPKGNTVAMNKPTPKVDPTAPAKPPKYPELRIEICKGDTAITMEKAKEMLGWETEADYVAKLKAVDANLNEDSVKFGGDYFLTDRQGNKVRLGNNTRNRPWGEGVSLAYMQDILKKHWALNGETIIIGVNGRILSGQHRLIALIFAEQERTKDESAAHWAEFWDCPCVLECVVAYGVEESAHVTRTLDNVKSRSLSDVIFADTEMFGQYKAVERKTVARMLDYSVRFLWSRAGENKDQWAPKRTHAESLDFVDRHPRLKECIRHVFDADKGENRIGKYIYPGHAAALLYLMGHAGTSHDDIEDYMVKRPTDEKGLKWGQFKKAKMFWTDLANDAPELKNLRLARRPLPNDTDGFSGFVFAEADDGGGSFDERVGMLIRAWEAYKVDQPIDVLELTYESATDDTTGATIYTQKEFPTIQDSIDVGKTIKVKKTPKAPKEGDEASELDALTEGDEEGTEGEEASGETPTPKPAVKSTTAPKEAAKAEWDGLKAQYGDNHMLFHRSPNNSGNHLVFFSDAEKLGEIIGSKPRLHPATGVTQIVLGASELAECAAKVKEAGLNVLILSREGGKWNAKPYQTAEESFETPNNENADVPAEGEGEVSEVESAPVPAPSAKKVTIKRKP